MLKKGFTLIELLVVIAIIGILAGLILVNVSGARVKSRDARRMADLSSVRTALEMYADAGLVVTYPSTCTAGANTTCAFGEAQWRNSITYYTTWVLNPPGASFRPQYISVLPGDPRNTGDFSYYYRSTGYDYKLMALTMESTDGMRSARQDGGARNTCPTPPADTCSYEIYTSNAQSWNLPAPPSP